jgi:hypothetical protein
VSHAFAPPSVRRRPGAKTRGSILLVHIAPAGAWVGIDVVMAVRVVTALLSRGMPGESHKRSCLHLSHGR